MKRINLKLLIISVLFISLGINAQNPYERHWKKNMEKVRVISYNIFNGFEWRKDLDRQQRMVEWIKEKDPEILALQELCGFNQERLSELAKKWGHPYAAILKSDGYPVGVTSKKPIDVKARILKDCGHGLLHVETYGMNILVTHLNPASTERRNLEAQTIVKYIKDNKLTNLLLMGDMNACSPIDAEFMEAHGRSSNTDYSVISHFLALPLKDLCRIFVAPEHRWTDGTPILMGRSKNEDYRRRHLGVRIDYIFASQDLEGSPVDGYIWNGEDTYYLSDHFPIGVDLLFDRNNKK